MYYFITIKKYLESLKQNHDDTIEARQEAERYNTERVKNNLEIAIAKMQQKDDASVQNYKRDIAEGIRALRQNNNIRVPKLVEDKDINMLNALRMVRHIPDELALAAYRHMSASCVCTLALKNIVLASWSDDENYKLPSDIENVNWPMTMKETEKIIKGIEDYCNMIMNPEQARKQKIYDDERAFLHDVVGVDQDKIERFKTAVSTFEKY